MNEKMTVGELIIYLQTLPPESTVDYCRMSFPGGSFSTPSHASPMLYVPVGFNQYQTEAHKYARYHPAPLPPLAYVTMGLAGEVGEFSNKVKKLYRDGDGVPTEIQRKDLAAECGDCVWYLADIATVLDMSFGDVATDNLSKLESRAQRGVIHGSGDNR